MLEPAVLEHVEQLAGDLLVLASRRSRRGAPRGRGRASRRRPVPRARRTRLRAPQKNPSRPSRGRGPECESGTIDEPGFTSGRASRAEPSRAPAQRGSRARPSPGISKVLANDRLGRSRRRPGAQCQRTRWPTRGTCLLYRRMSHATVVAASGLKPPRLISRGANRTRSSETCATYATSTSAVTRCFCAAPERRHPSTD